MQGFPYALELRGHATPVSPGVLLTRAHGPHALFGGEHEAVLEGRLSLLDGGAFELAATIGLDEGLRSGTAICEVDRGSGLFTGATGRIVSSFLLSDTGELTDMQAGVVQLAVAVVDEVA